MATNANNPIPATANPPAGVPWDQTPEYIALTNRTIAPGGRTTYGMLLAIAAIRWLMHVYSRASPYGSLAHRPHILHLRTSYHHAEYMAQSHVYARTYTGMEGCQSFREATTEGRQQRPADVRALAQGGKGSTAAPRL